MRRERHTPRCRELRTGRRWDSGFHGRPTCGVYLAVIRSSSAVLCLAPAGRRCSSIFEFSARLCKVKEQALTRADHCSPSASTQGSYGSPGRFAVIMSKACHEISAPAGRRWSADAVTAEIMGNMHCLQRHNMSLKQHVDTNLCGGMILPMLISGEGDTTHQPANSTFLWPRKTSRGFVFTSASRQDVVSRGHEFLCV